MSALSMRLKRRARILAAGVALSAATLVILPGVAEAKGGGHGDGPRGEHNANHTRGSIGTATAQDGADVKNNNVNANPQASVGHGSNEAKNDQRAGGGGSPDGGSANHARNDNETRGSIGAVTAQDGADVKGNNVNANPQVSALGSFNESNAHQKAGGGSGDSATNNERNGNDTRGSIGEVTLQDGVDLDRNNVDVSPQVSALGSSNDARIDQQAGSAGNSANEERNDNETSGSIGAVTLQDGVNFGGNGVDVSPQISALGSSNEGYADQRSGSGGSNSPANGDERNGNRTSGSIGVVSGQDVADISGNNVGANPQVALLGGSNRANTDQQTSGSGGSAANDERNDNGASGSVGAVAAQDGVNLNRNNVGANPQVSALDSSNEANTGQQAGSGGGTSADDGPNGNETSGSIGAVALQEGVNLSDNNVYASPQVSALDGSNEANTDQQTGGGGGSAADEPNGNETSGSILTATVQDGVDLDRNNVGLGPQVSALDGSNRANTDQQTGGGSGSGPAAEERNGNLTGGSIGTLTAQDIADGEANDLNAVPQVSVLGSSNEAKTDQRGGGSNGRHPPNHERNSNRTEGSVGTVAAQDVLDVDGDNLNATPQVSALDSSNSADTDQQSGGSGRSAADEPNGNETSGSILTATVQDGVDLDRNNVGLGPQVSALDSSNEADTDQQSGAGPGSTNDEQNTNDTSGSVATLTGQDVLGVEGNNLNAVPQVSVLDGSNEADTDQQTGGSGGSADDEERNANETGGSVGTVTLQDVLNLDGNNLNANPQVSVLDGSNEADTEQNVGDPGDGGGGSPGDGGPGDGDGDDPGGGSGGDPGNGGGGPGDGGGGGPGSGGPGDTGGPGGGGPGGGGGSPGDEPTDVYAFARGFPLLGRVVDDILGRAGSDGPGFADLSPGAGAGGSAAVPAAGAIPLSDVVPSRSALGGVDPRLTPGGSAAQDRPILASLGRGDSVLASLGRGGSEGGTARFSALAAGPSANTSASTKGARSLPDTGGAGFWPLALGLSLLLWGFALTVGKRRRLVPLRR